MLACPGVAVDLSSSRHQAPLIGISADAADDQFRLRRSYADSIHAAGGVPVILPCIPSLAAAYLDRCDGIILSGGDDPIMTNWGVAMHPKATPLDPLRQEFELALLHALDQKTQTPALGICLGMQLMGLHAGGTLDQHLPDTLATADMHWDKRSHAVEGEFGNGQVHSHHRQALTDPGALRVIARAPDGVIEAVSSDDRRFYVGVQWHPERTLDTRLGSDLFRRFVEQCKNAAKD